MLKENRRERKKLEAKERIIAAALQMFFQRGFQDTTVAQIMVEADLGTGTFYNYFQSKEELVRYCLSTKVTEAMLAIKQLQQNQQSYAAKLAEIIYTISLIFVESKPLLGLFMQLRQTNLEVPGLPSHNLLFRDVLTEVFRQGQEQGEFKQDIPAEVVSELIFGILQSTVTSAEQLNFSENLEAKLNIIFGGILNRAGDRDRISIMLNSTLNQPRERKEQQCK